MPKATKDEIEIIKQYIKNSNEKFLILEHFVEMVLNENRKHNLIGNNTVEFFAELFYNIHICVLMLSKKLSIYIV